MREYRLSKDTTAHYTSLKDLPARPHNVKTSDEEKLKKQQEEFLGECNICHQRLKWIENSNICCCVNPECKGYTHTDIDVVTGEKIRYNVPSIRFLNSKGVEIATNIFS